MNNCVSILRQYTDITDLQAERLSIISDKLQEMNGILNLTALKTDEDIAMLHLYDSLTLLRTKLFDGGKKVIDIGCGGGFPTLPIAACCDVQMTANDSTAKKLKFVSDTASLAGIKIDTLCGRAEELSQKEYRESFDIAISRGVARLNILVEWCMPFVKQGGYFVALKGRGAKEELDEAQNGIKILGGQVVDVIPCPIPLTDHEHALIVVKKISKTPALYPRQNSKITKKPL